MSIVKFEVYVESDDVTQEELESIAYNAIETGLEENTYDEHEGFAPVKFDIYFVEPEK